MEAKANVTIPRDRIGALIGPEGEVKSQIEKACMVDLTVNSETGLVDILPKRDNNDPSSLLRAKDMVSAIGRGFSPSRALTLTDEDNILDIIDLREIFGKSESDIQRIKGRIIGRDGKTRRLIEELTGALISVYGHSIGMIGDYDSVTTAREALEMLIKGKQHASVYGFLRIKRREAKKRKMVEVWEKPVREP